MLNYNKKIAKIFFTDFIRDMDRINFTGLTNISGCVSILPERSNQIHKANLLLKLTNDANDYDLSDFVNVLKRCSPNIGNCKASRLDILHIMTVVNNRTMVPELAINRNIIKPSKKTVPMFDFIAKLTRRIMKMDDDDLFYNVSNDYYSFTDENLMPGIRLHDIGVTDSNFKEIIDSVTHPCNIKQSAEQINKDILAQMIEWLK